MQRLGFELTDLALWMWDPEKSAVRSRENAAVIRPKAKKRRPALRIENGNPPGKKSRAETKKTARSSRIKSEAAIRRGMREKGTNPHQPAIQRAGIQGAIAGTNGRYLNSPLIQSGNNESQPVRLKADIADVQSGEPGKNAQRNGPTKVRGAAIKNKRKTPAARRRVKIGTFPVRVLPAAAALN